MAAAEALRGSRGVLLNEYDWGGWLIWNVPERPVFVDGRLFPFLLNGVLFEQRAAVDVLPPWRDVLSRWNVRQALLRPDRALSFLDYEILEQLVAEGFPLVPGAVGENLTVLGLNVQQMRPGTILQIGDVLAKLSELKLDDNTLIFFVSDNGGPTAANTSVNGPLRGFKSQTWEGGIRMPFVAQWPGQIPAGRVCDEPACFIEDRGDEVAGLGEDAGARCHHEGPRHLLGDRPLAEELPPEVLGRVADLHDQHEEEQHAGFGPQRGLHRQVADQHRRGVAQAVDGDHQPGLDFGDPLQKPLGVARPGHARGNEQKREHRQRDVEQALGPFQAEPLRRIEPGHQHVLDRREHEEHPEQCPVVAAPRAEERSWRGSRENARQAGSAPTRSAVHPPSSTVTSKTRASSAAPWTRASSGGANVTSDIAIGLRTPIDKAEAIKIQHGAALAAKYAALSLLARRRLITRSGLPLARIRNALASAVSHRVPDLHLTRQPLSARALLRIPRTRRGGHMIRLVVVLIASLIATVFVLPSGVIRALGGWVSDKLGAHTVTWWVMWTSWLALFLLSYPRHRVIIQTVRGEMTLDLGLDAWVFTLLLFVVGIAWGVGKASVFKYIGDEYPHNIGVISGIVGLIGGLGGFLFPILFGLLVDFTGINSSIFMLLFAVTCWSLVWMYTTEVRGVRTLRLIASTGREAARTEAMIHPQMTQILADESPVGNAGSMVRH